MKKENRPLVTDKPVEAQDFTKTTHHFKGIYGIYLKLVKKNEQLHHVTGWTWTHKEFDRLRPNTSWSPGGRDQLFRAWCRLQGFWV